MYRASIKSAIISGQILLRSYWNSFTGIIEKFGQLFNINEAMAIDYYLLFAVLL